jgi:hypothetical protein
MVLPAPTLACPIELVELTLPALLSILSLNILELGLVLTFAAVPINLELRVPLLEFTEIEVF